MTAEAEPDPSPEPEIFRIAEEDLAEEAGGWGAVALLMAALPSWIIAQFALPLAAKLVSIVGLVGLAISLVALWVRLLAGRRITVWPEAIELSSGGRVTRLQRSGLLGHRWAGARAIKLFGDPARGGPIRVSLTLWPHDKAMAWLDGVPDLDWIDTVKMLRARRTSRRSAKSMRRSRSTG